jgi:hypothetical protein
MRSPNVYNYLDGHLLRGVPSEELIVESGKIDDGAVPAYFDETTQRWEYATPSLEDSIRKRGAHIFTVWVE